MTLLRSLRAIIWLRWKLLVGQLRVGRRRDRFEEISRLVATFVPMALFALSVGSFVAISMLAFMGGRAMATGLVDPPTLLIIIRLTLIVMIALLVIVTLVSPVQTSIAKYRRLLLLPIPIGSLHLIEVIANMFDPWLGMLVPGAVAMGIGLAVGGRPHAGVVALAAGAALMIALASLGALLGSLVGWLLRSRRRGEVFTLVVVIAMALLAGIPGMLSGEIGHSRRRSATQAADQQEFSPGKFNASLPRWSHYIPSEMYGRALDASMLRADRLAWLYVAGLAGEAAILFALSAVVHRRMINAIEGDTSARGAGSTRGAGWRIPGVPAAISAVALTQWRITTRTVRGRLAIFLPGPMLGVMTLVFRRVPDDQRWVSLFGTDGYIMLAAGLVFIIYALQPFSVNLFGSDRTGLALEFLSPITETDLSRGKVLGCALVFLTSAAMCLAVAVAVAPAGPVVAWIGVLEGGLATFLWVSPVAVAFSAVLPVAADLSKTGPGGNPHPIAMFAGAVIVLIVAAIAAAASSIGGLWLQHPTIFCGVMGLWLIASGIASWFLIHLSARLVALRRENLLLVAGGR